MLEEAKALIEDAKIRVDKDEIEVEEIRINLTKSTTFYILG